MRQEVINAIETVAQVQSEIIREISVFAVSNSQAAAAEAAERERIAEGTLGASTNPIANSATEGLLEIEREQDEVIIRLASQDSFRSAWRRLDTRFLRAS